MEVEQVDEDDRVTQALAYRFWEQQLFDFALGKHPGEDPALVHAVFRVKYGWR